MALTMADAAAYGGFDDFESGLYKRFTEVSPVLEFLPWVQIQGNTLTFTVEDSLPTAAHRAVNGTTTSTNGTANKQTAELCITYAQGQLDRYMVKTQGGQNGAVDMKLALWDGLAQAVSNSVDQAFWEGDPVLDVNSPAGMRQLITGNQAVAVTTNGGPLTLDLLDQIIDTVPFDGRHAFMNRSTRRRINTLLRAAGVSVQMNMTPNEVGRMPDMYGDVEFHVVERTGDASSILGFDEQCGSNATTASLYVCSFGEDRLHGIYAGENPGGLDVQDFGELQTQPQMLGRLEVYWNVAKKHDRAASRLRGITAA